MCYQYLFNERSYDMFRGDPGGDALSPAFRALAVFGSLHQDEDEGSPHMRLHPHSMHVAFLSHSMRSVANCLFLACIAIPTLRCVTVLGVTTKDSK